jgi:hypothetical protein
MNSIIHAFTLNRTSVPLQYLATASLLYFAVTKSAPDKIDAPKTISPVIVCFILYCTDILKLATVDPLNISHATFVEILCDHHILLTPFRALLLTLLSSPAFTNRDRTRPIPNAFAMYIRPTTNDNSYILDALTSRPGLTILTYAPVFNYRPFFRSYILASRRLLTNDISEPFRRTRSDTFSIDHPADQPFIIASFSPSFTIMISALRDFKQAVHHTSPSFKYSFPHYNMSDRTKPSFYLTSLPSAKPSYHPESTIFAQQNDKSFRHHSSWQRSLAFSPTPLQNVGIVFNRTAFVSFGLETKCSTFLIDFRTMPELNDDTVASSIMTIASLPSEADRPSLSLAISILRQFDKLAESSARLYEYRDSSVPRITCVIRILSQRISSLPITNNSTSIIEALHDSAMLVSATTHDSDFLLMKAAFPALPLPGVLTISQKLVALLNVVTLTLAPYTTAPQSYFDCLYSYTARYFPLMDPTPFIRLIASDLINLPNPASSLTIDDRDSISDYILSNYLTSSDLCHNYNAPVFPHVPSVQLLSDTMSKYQFATTMSRLAQRLPTEPLTITCSVTDYQVTCPSRLIQTTFTVPRPYRRRSPSPEHDLDYDDIHIDSAGNAEY